MASLMRPPEQVRELKSQIEATNVEIEQAEQSYELSRAAELKYAKLPELQRRLRLGRRRR
jgi:ATP-dependent Clp protease ATP-binding subunit ClpB